MFADLYSQTRGANRHKTIARILTELLPNHPKVRACGFSVPAFDYYVEWVHDPNSLLSDEGLKRAIEKSSNDQARNELQVALKWSQRVNEMVAEVVKNVPPFQFVRESLEKVSSVADIIVCSATPTKALEREWAEHNLSKYINVIGGQEMGSKSEQLAIVSHGKYEKMKIIMLGDAPGDQDAAQKNEVLFYPIVPGDEDSSWKKFYKEGFDKFISGNYAGLYEHSLITVFEKSLPTHPSWDS